MGVGVSDERGTPVPQVWRDGAQYAGEWFGDKPSGLGVENYPDGSSYVGQYEDDMRHGYTPHPG